MPTVPTYDSAQVGPAGPVTPYRQPAQVDNQATGRQLQSAGAAVQDAGAVLTQEEVNAQGIANQVRVDAALNQIRQQQLALTYDPQNGYTNKKGAAALDPDPLGRSLPQAYGEQLNDTINDVSAKLGNDAQRRVFGEQAAAMSTQFGGEVQRHMLQEFRSYGLEAQQGTIKLAADAAKLNWDKPDQIAPQIQSAQAAVWKAGQINGEPGNLTTAKIKDVTSAIHAGVIEAAITNNNPTYAQQYLGLNKAGMTADDILKATGLTNHAMDGRAALSAVQGAVAQLAPQIQPSDMDRLTNIVMGMESSGNRDAVGRFVPGQGTAKGDMQVMDATNKNPGFGVTPAKDDSAAERSRVGRDYLGALVKNYGDPALAMAAYNAGPGNVDKAIADATKAGNPGKWLDALATYQSTENHAETVAYVQKGMAKLGAGGGAAQFPTESQFVQAALDRLGENPRIEQVKMTREQAVAQYTMMDKSRKEQGEQAVAQAQQALAANGGSLAALDPNIKAAVLRWAPDKFDNLSDYAGKIADPVRADNLSAYNQAVSHPDELAKMTDTVFESFIKANFTQRTARAIVNMRDDEINGKTDNSAANMNRAAVNRSLNAALDSLRIPTQPVKGTAFGENEKERLGGIRQYVDQSILDAQRQSGQKMTTDQINSHIKALFATDVTFKNTLWYGAKGADTSQKLMAMQLTDLPAGAEQGIRQSLIAAGNKAPTNNDILNQYRRLHAK